MSSLTVALAILGGLVLAGVIGYNAWTSRRNTPRQPQRLPADDGEAAAPQAPRSEYGDEEPVLHTEPPGAGNAERHEPLFDPDLPAPGVLAAGAAERRGALDPLIDVIAPIALDGLVSGDAALCRASAG